MSLFDSDLFQDLFLPENINSSFNPSTLSDDMNDFLFESTHNPPKREIKFILTKEDTSKISFLKKKINYGIGDCTLSPSNGGRWSNEEQQRFAEAVLLHGNEWKKIQNHVDTRNLTQVRSHAQKFLMKLKETSFFKSLNLDFNLSWTKVMNYLRSNIEYNKLKEVLFSVEQNEEKNTEKKQKKNKKIKSGKKFGIEDLIKCNELNSDINGESYHFFFENDDNSYKNNKLEEENEELEKFIACFNNTSTDINLNSSFEEFSSKNQQNY